MRIFKSIVFALLVTFFSAVAIAAEVNVNTATQEEIKANLTGVGEIKALAIVKYREANGDFKKVEDLLKVKGIGEAVLAKNKDKIVLE